MISEHCYQDQLQLTSNKMNIRLDSKEKAEHVRHFLLELKKMEGIEPFLVIEDIQKYGIYDFCYVNQRTTSFDIIEKRLKEEQYGCIQELADDIKLIFVTVSDYVFLGDELQFTCDKFVKIVSEFQRDFIRCFENSLPPLQKEKSKTAKQKKDQEEIKDQPAKICSQKIKNQKKIDLQATQREREASNDKSRLNLADSLEMLYFIRDRNQNSTALKLMASYFSIGHQKQGNFFININPNSSFWNLYSPQTKK